MENDCNSEAGAKALGKATIWGRHFERSEKWQSPTHKVWPRKSAELREADNPKGKKQHIFHQQNLIKKV
jgi:hypothetical protein